MAIRFSNTIDDFLAMSEFHYKASPAVKRQLSNYQWTVGLGIFVLPLLISVVFRSHGNGLFDLLVAAIVAAVFAYIAPISWRRSVRRQTLRMYNEGSNKAAFSEREMEVTPDGIVSRSAYGESLTAWGAVERIESTSDYTFIYISSVMAYVIPNKRIPEHDLREFLFDLKTQYKPDHTLPTPLPVPRPIAEPIKQTVGVTNTAAGNPTEPANANRWYVGQ